MTAYAWPGFPVNRFEMSIRQNLRVFTGPYTPTTQALDLLGERWGITLTLAPTATRDSVTAASIEAFFDRLRGQVNSITLGHLKLTAPQGTMRGSVAAQWKNNASVNANWLNNASQPANWSTGEPVTRTAIAQLGNTVTIGTLPGRTLLAGDLIGLGTQLVRVMANATADGSGNLAIEFAPRARTAIPAGTTVLWSAPTANFILKPGATFVPTSWTPDVVDGATIELIETF